MHEAISNARLLDFRGVLWLLVGLLSAGAASARSADTVQAHWQLQGIKFTYTGFTTAYACESLERKVREILVTLGAHPSTKVSAVGCVGPQPTRTAFVRIATATPAQMNEAQETRRVDDEPAQNRAQLLDRMQLDEDFGSRSFAAHWRTFELSENRKLDLAPGDCELMAQLRDQVLPELGVRIMQESISCVPHQVSITTPTLQVSALVPAGSGQSG